MKGKKHSAAAAVLFGGLSCGGAAAPQKPAAS
jgi:hypothetical protein